MNIVLCGMMGVGKTSVGIRLAELTDRRWYDTDVMITERHGRISDLFEYYGEAYFRSLETDITRELAAQDGLVISTGGGLVLKPENSELLKRNGKIFFLRASFQTLLTRVKADGSRPLLKDTGSVLSVKLQQLLTERTPVYEHAADYIISTDGKSVDEVAEEIISAVKEQGDR